MIDVLEAIGRRTEDIDVVAFTHLHFDHAGWAFAHGAQDLSECPLRVGRAGMGAV
jgi:glyoxylase-like metal-dependent hydrolase (beta-lactamase superfamily II)